MKNFAVRVLLIGLVVLLCVVFAREKSIFSDEEASYQLENISSENIELTVVDDETVRLENTINGDDLLFNWNLYNTIDGVELSSENKIATESGSIIEFQYDNLEDISFQAIVTDEDNEYTSSIFYVSEDWIINQIEDEDTSSITPIVQSEKGIDDIVSIAYIVFLLVIVLLYYLVPKNFQWCIILLGSTIFYLVSGVEFIIFLLAASYMTFYIGKRMSKKREEVNLIIKNETDSKKKKEIKKNLQSYNKNLLIMAFVFILGILVVIKYSSFVITNINNIIGINIPIIYLLMPLGLSFYTFIMIAYLIDVYRGKYPACEKFSRFFLFASFFPQISQGPIARYDLLSPQLEKHHSFDYDNFCKGCQRILWGFFIKLVLAERLAIFVNDIYDDYSSNSWLMLVFASLVFSIQVYADFYSSMEIAIGSAQLFGVKLSENFLRPYFSKNMPEFWRRWHVTLGTWFKDYLFYPIAISKTLMKFGMWSRRKIGVGASKIITAAMPIMGVWIFTGLWHGASWTFVAWGIYHGILILLSAIFAEKVAASLKKTGINTESFWYSIVQMIKVFILCTIGRVFFRADTISDSFAIFKDIFTLSNPTNELISLSDIDLLVLDYIVMGVATILLFTVSVIQERSGSVRDVIGNRNICIRWFIWIGIICLIACFGMYGSTSTFIYEAF